MEEVTGAISTPFLQKLNGYLDNGLDTKLRGELEMLRDVLIGIINVFAKAEWISSLLYESRSGSNEKLDLWIRSLKKTIYDIEDELDLIMLHNKKQKSRTSLLPFIGYYKQLAAIRNLRNAMETIMKEAEYIHVVKKEVEKMTSNRYLDREEQRCLLRLNPRTTIVESTPVGIDDTFNNLRQLLMGTKEDQSQRQKLRVISVIGTSGMGKSTIVWKIWKDKVVMRDFECRAWVVCGAFHGSKETLSSVLDEFCYGIAPYAMGIMDEGALVHAINSQLQGKKFLLVLDGVRGKEVWDLVAPALPHNSGGRVIITTTRDLALTSDIAYPPLHLEGLTFDHAYELFCGIAFPSKDATHQQKEVAKAIVERCYGNPLAIVTVANVARTHTDWEKLQHDLRFNVDNEKLATVFMLTYNKLSCQSKYVFLYCCLFPEDSKIRVRSMIRLCVAEGFVDDSEHSTAEETVATCLQQLIDSSLIMVNGSLGNVETCTVHDIVRDIGLAIVKKRMLREFGTWNGETSIPPKAVRHLSIVGDSSKIPSTKDDVAFVRSCFVSDVENIQSSSICRLLLGGHRLLRVLNLRNTRNTDTIVHQLCSLIHLRYLGLRGTDLNELPASLSKLCCLQTLDIRDTQVSILPGTFIRLEKLRHVHLVGSFMRKVVEFPLGRKKMKPLQIQTLAGVRASTRLIEELGCWTRLKKLSIGKVSGDDSIKLCASINNMCFLQSLTIKARGVDKLQMGTLSPEVDWSSLHTLKIGGRIESLSHLVSCFCAISRLHLWDSMLDEDEDPFVCLQHLTNLEVLCLSNAYSGKQMICNAEWFPKLKKLSILRMRKLEHWIWIIKQETKHSLEDLFVGYCPKLNEVPQDIDKISSQLLVQVSEMPQEFTEALQEKSKGPFPFIVNLVPQFVQVEESASHLAQICQICY